MRFGGPGAGGRAARGGRGGGRPTKAKRGAGSLKRRRRAGCPPPEKVGRSWGFLKSHPKPRLAAALGGPGRGRQAGIKEQVYAQGPVSLGGCSRPAGGPCGRRKRVWGGVLGRSGGVAERQGRPRCPARCLSMVTVRRFFPWSIPQSALPAELRSCAFAENGDFRACCNSWRLRFWRGLRACPAALNVCASAAAALRVRKGALPLPQAHAGEGW